MDIVVAEDYPDLRAMITDLLRHEGYEVRPAADGVEALGLIEERCPDLLITDYVMPRKDGVNLVREARQLEPSCQLDAVLNTAYPKDARLTELLGEPRVTYVMKGQSRDLLAVVRRIEARRANDR